MPNLSILLMGCGPYSTRHLESLVVRSQAPGRGVVAGDEDDVVRVKFRSLAVLWSGTLPERKTMHLHALLTQWQGLSGWRLWVTIQKSKSSLTGQNDTRCSSKCGHKKTTVTCV